MFVKKFILFIVSNVLLLLLCRFLILHTLRIHTVSIELELIVSLVIMYHGLIWFLMIPPFFFVLVDGGSGSDRNNSEPEPKGKSVPRRDALPKPTQQAPTSSLTPQNVW